MAKSSKKMEVLVAPISIIKRENHDYISLTDMVRNFEDGYVLIEKWLRNKNTIEFKLYLIKEFQRLKEAETNHKNLSWNVQRLISKIIHNLQGFYS